MIRSKMKVPFMLAAVDGSHRHRILHADSARDAQIFPIVEPFPHYDHLKLRLEGDILWATMCYPERACFTSGLIADGKKFQSWLRQRYRGANAKRLPFRYLVWCSNARKAWSLGGDLTTFVRLIRRRDAATLRAYAHAAIDGLHANYRACELPIMTVALVKGDAFGGGVEAMLTNDIVIAQRGARFGLPEVLFGLFPGMGAYSFLRRKVGKAMALSFINDGRSRSADEMYELGLVDIVCEKGEGEATMLRYTREHGSRFEANLALARACRRSDPVTREELADTIELWINRAMQLRENELRRMEALARQQQRVRAGIQQVLHFSTDRPNCYYYSAMDAPDTSPGEEWPPARQA